MQMHSSTSIFDANAFIAGPRNWTGAVRRQLEQRGRPATESEIFRLAKQLQRLHPAATAAMSSSPADCSTDSGQGDPGAEFIQTLRSLEA